MDPFSLISLIFGVIMSGAGIWAQNKANQEAIDLTRENREDQQQFNAEEAEKARQANIDQYNLLYSPQARVKQLREAGLSPALMYSGGGAATAGGTTQMASAGVASAPTINPIIPQSGMLDLLLQKAEATKTEKEAKKTETETKAAEKSIEEIESKIGVNIATTENLKLQNKLLENDKKISDGTIEEQIETIKENYELIKKTKEKTIEEINGLKTENSNKQKYIDAEIDNLNAQTDLYVKQGALAVAQKALTKAEEILTNHKTWLTDREAEKLYQETRTLKATAEKMESAPWSSDAHGLIDIIFRGLMDQVFNVAKMVKQASKAKENSEEHKKPVHGAGGTF